jgi:phosphonate transport system substrate-binding protein
MRTHCQQHPGRCTRAAIAGVLALLLAVCGRSPEKSGPSYSSTAGVKEQPQLRFAVHPWYNPAKLFEAYGPLVAYVNERLSGARLSLEASRDYGVYLDKIRKREADLLLPNPWQTLVAMDCGYRVIAEAGEASDFKGVFIVKKGSGIHAPADLAGKTVCYPSPTALAACVMPQYFLFRHGVDVNNGIKNLYVGSQESSIMNVYIGTATAGATWPPPWRAFQKDHPAEAATLEVIWETEPLINNSVMVRNDVDPALRERIRAILVDLPKTERGRAILTGIETACFIPASDRDYAVVRTYVAAFEREVRKVEMK